MISTCVIKFLREWQELVSGIIGAVAITSTVWWTLSAERRRREAEAAALRVALGAEVRQFAANALRALQRLIGAHLANFTCHTLTDAVRFVEPVIYPHAAITLGVLGSYAYDVELFFNRVSVVGVSLMHLQRNFAIHEPIPPQQVATFGDALLDAAETAVNALRAFPNTAHSKHDTEFVTAVKAARNSFQAEKQAYANQQ